MPRETSGIPTTLTDRQRAVIESLGPDAIRCFNDLVKFPDYKGQASTLEGKLELQNKRLAKLVHTTPDREPYVYFTPMGAQIAAKFRSAGMLIPGKAGPRRESKETIVKDHTLQSIAGLLDSPAATGPRRERLAKALLAVTEAKPTGSVQMKLLAFVNAAGGVETLTDVARNPEFRGVHFGRLMTAAQELSRKGLIMFDGEYVGPPGRPQRGAPWESTKLAEATFHIAKPWTEVYVDTAFLNAVQRVLPGFHLKHLGFGEFYLEGPGGRIDFVRGAPSFPGQSGRSHYARDDQGGKLVQQLVTAAEKKGLASPANESVGEGYYDQYPSTLTALERPPHPRGKASIPAATRAALENSIAARTPKDSKFKVGGKVGIMLPNSTMNRATDAVGAPRMTDMQGSTFWSGALADIPVEVLVALRAIVKGKLAKKHMDIIKAAMGATIESVDETMADWDFEAVDEAVKLGKRATALMLDIFALEVSKALDGSAVPIAREMEDAAKHPANNLPPEVGALPWRAMLATAMQSLPMRKAVRDFAAKWWDAVQTQGSRMGLAASTMTEIENALNEKLGIEVEEAIIGRERTLDKWADKLRQDGVIESLRSLGKRYPQYTMERHPAGWVVYRNGDVIHSSRTLPTVYDVINQVRYDAAEHRLESKSGQNGNGSGEVKESYGYYRGLSNEKLLALSTDFATNWDKIVRKIGTEAAVRDSDALRAELERRGLWNLRLHREMWKKTRGESIAEKKQGMSSSAKKTTGEWGKHARGDRKTSKRQMNKKRRQQGKQATKQNEARLASSQRNQIGKDMDRAGFGGQRMFRSHGEAINVLHGVLDKHGLQIADVVSADIFRAKAAGSHSFRLEVKTADPFAPDPVLGRGVHVSWTHIPERGGYEFIGYIT